MKQEKDTTTLERMLAIPFPGSLRDWFAGHSPYNADHAIEIINGKKYSSAPVDEVLKTLAKLNYAYAAAMLAERSKP